MAKGPKLKVYRLPIGFHDAYVAAPSQKAAIEAWGSDKDVFTRGRAELVEDPKLTGEPLARPGEVVKRLRGTAEEQVAALGETPPPAPGTKKEKGGQAGKTAKATGKAPKPPKPKKVKPRPSRAELDEAGAALEAAEARHEAAIRELRDREAALARERKALEKAQARERETLAARRDRAEAAYDKAMRKWREG